MPMITPLLDRGGNLPLYMQIYAYIRNEIEFGRIAADTALPSIRQLAQHLCIAKNTVETAYGQLVAEGYISNRERSRYVVLSLDKLFHERYTHTLPIQSRDDKAQQRSESAYEQEVEASPTKSAEILYDFQYGDIAFDKFPHTAWKSCVNEALNGQSAHVLGYGYRLGHPDLRKEIAAYVFQSRGVRCTPEQIVIGAGTQQLTGTLIPLINLQDGQAAMEEPGYHGVRSMLLGFGCRVIPIPVEEEGISVSSLNEFGDVSLVYVTPSHQFPLGMVMPIAKRFQLLQWAAENEGYILEDDYDSEFRYSSAPIPSLKALDEHDRVIYMGTFSKSFMPGARLSYMILPHRLLQRQHDRLGNISPSVSALIQEAVWLFMKKGHFARHLRRMRSIYQARHKAITAAIMEHFGDRCRVIGDRCGMHLLLDVKGRSARELLALAEAGGCRVYSPDKHWSNPADCPQSLVMLGFGCMTEQQLNAGIAALSEAWFPPSVV